MLVLAFSPTDTEHSELGHHWTLFDTDPTLTNPHMIEDVHPRAKKVGDELLNVAIEEMDHPREYGQIEGEKGCWRNFVYDSTISEDPKRFTKDMLDQGKSQCAYCKCWYDMNGERPEQHGPRCRVRRMRWRAQIKIGSDRETKRSLHSFRNLLK